MARNRNRDQLIQLFVAWFVTLRWQWKLAVAGLILLVLLVAYFTADTRQPVDPTLPDSSRPTGEPSAELLQRERYLFCWWNLENFFDDKVDGWGDRVDAEYDQWMASNPDLLGLKLSNLCNVLLKMNGGIGPDILACGEVEDTPNARVPPGALILLRDKLNSAIEDTGLRYRELLWKRMSGGRAIITAIVTRLPVVADQTRLVYRNERILQGVIRVRNQDLVVLSSHWTSRVTDKVGTRRAAYGDVIHEYANKKYQQDPDLAMIVAGDFNDEPEDPSVRDHLRASTDRTATLEGGADLTFFNLMRQPHLAGLGTIDGRGGKLDMFDQIVATPAMLRLSEPGWKVDVDSVRIVTEDTTQRVRGSGRLRPFRFGSRNDEGQRGYSDHLPVTVNLILAR